MLHLHAISQIKPKLLIKVDAEIRPCNCISTRVHTAYLGPNQDVLYGHILFRLEIPLIPSKPPNCILACPQYLSKMLKRYFIQDLLSIFNP